MSKGRCATAAPPSKSRTFSCWSRCIAAFRRRTRRTVLRSRYCGNTSEPSLLLRYSRPLADRIPAHELVRHMLAECLRRGSVDHYAGLGQSLLHVGLSDRLIERSVELGDDGARRAARREEAVPRGDVV